MAVASKEREVWRKRRSGVRLARSRSSWRSEYGRDRARIIHSAGFRRLQAKTQVLGIGEGDFHRTRLTHSMEAAQVGRGIVRALQENWIRRRRAKSIDDWQVWLPSVNSIEAISLAHDIGHPPFGHGGEIALNYAMRQHGGFEGNGQTLRLLAKLESHTAGYGLDLTRRTLLGILKYPVAYERVMRQATIEARPDEFINRDLWLPPKCYMGGEEQLVRWILRGFSKSDRETFALLNRSPSEAEHGRAKYHSLDTAIMELADDIAYGVHDLEDAITLKLVTREDLLVALRAMDSTWARQVGIERGGRLLDLLFSATGHDRKRTIGALVNAFIVSVEPFQLREFSHPLLSLQVRLEEPANALLRQFKDLVLRKVIYTPQVQTLEFRGQRLILALYTAIASDPRRFLKESFREAWESEDSTAGHMRVVCDYVSGMTDEYATRIYERMFVPRQGHVFDRL